jgi:hypothetical protein
MDVERQQSSFFPCVVPSLKPVTKLANRRAGNGVAGAAELFVRAQAWCQSASPGAADHQSKVMTGQSASRATRGKGVHEESVFCEKKREGSAMPMKSRRAERGL